MSDRVTLRWSYLYEADGYGKGHTSTSKDRFWTNVRWCDEAVRIVMERAMINWTKSKQKSLGTVVDLFGLESLTDFAYFGWWGIFPAAFEPPMIQLKVFEYKNYSNTLNWMELKGGSWSWREAQHLAVFQCSIKVKLESSLEEDWMIFWLKCDEFDDQISTKSL